MLTLTRKVGESICIGPDIRVKVFAYREGKVILAIDAPRHVAVDREEVRRAKQRERSNAQ